MRTEEDYERLFSCIREMRENDYRVCYGCSHYRGTELEAEVRDWYFLCMAGIQVSSIMANGDVGACLDIERRPETIQGNIFKDRFTDLWRNRFEIFRQDITCKNERCAACPDRRFCAGDSRHSWDYDKNEPLLCFRGTLWDKQ
jgi:radical SAM protein with 4Fe4S-binding SPASM domain